jgi:hypothetical protein
LEPFIVNRSQADYLVIQLFGGDNNLSHFVYQDLQEMAAGLRGNVVVLGLADLADRPASVVEVTAERGIQTLEDLGEIDTGDPEVLAHFVSRALITYPGAKKALGFWDHGTGVFDETDASEKLLTRSIHSVSRSERTRSYPARRLFFPKAALEFDEVTRGMLHDDTNGGVLTNLEAARMIDVSLQRANSHNKFDLIFSDTCLNGMIEVLDELSPYADCIVGSPELEPGDGWNYEGWMRMVGENPPADGEAWGHYAVEAFRVNYERFPKKHPCTLAAFRTENQISDAFRALLDTARADNSGFDAFFFVDHARSKAQAYARRDTYDLVDFARKLVKISETDKPALARAAQDLIAACDAAKVHWCRLGPTVQESFGLAFWFPSSRSMMRRDIGTYERLTFAKRTGWADYLGQFR